MTSNASPTYTILSSQTVKQIITSIEPVKYSSFTYGLIGESLTESTYADFIGAQPM